MSSVSSKSSSSAASIAAQQAAARAAAAAAAKKAAEAAAKKAAAEAAKKKAAEAAKRKDGFEGKHLAKLSKGLSKTKAGELARLNAKGTSVTNKDGSVTHSVEKDRKGTQLKQELTTTRNKFTGESKLKFEQTRTTGDKEIKNTITAEKDFFGRTTSSQARETKIKNGELTSTTSRQVDTDKYGGQKITNGKSTAVEANGVTTTDSSATTKGRFDTRQTVVEKKTEAFTGTGSAEAMKKGDRLTTTTSKSTTGTDFSLSSSKEFKDGTFTLKDSADWKKNSFNKEVGKEKQFQLRDPGPKADKGFTQQDKSSKLDKAQKVGDMLGAAGLKKTVWEEKKWDTTGKPEENSTPMFVGSRVGTRGEGSLTVGANGVDGKFKREAVAGLYAERKGEVEGDHGKASYQAQAKIEAKATFDASGKLNANGLDLRVGAKVGVSAEASVNGKLETKPVKFAGVDLTAGVEGNAKVSAELSAEATGKATITRNPPTAILEGKAGASAVVKAEADVKVSAGPFAVKASGYASAGAEATASGVIGYQDGKLKIGGSLGAALGVGLGGSVAVEVDVKQIGQMAKNTADINHDGKLDIHDATAAARKVVGDRAVNTAKAAVKTVANAARATVATTKAAATYVANTARAAATTVSNAAKSVASTVSNAASSAASAVSNAASSAASTVSNAAKTVRSWLPW